MSNHLVVILNCAGDPITAISEALNLVKLTNKRQELTFAGESFSLTIKPESDVQDLIQIHMLNVQIKKLKQELSKLKNSND